MQTAAMRWLTTVLLLLLRLETIVSQGWLPGLPGNNYTLDQLTALQSQKAVSAYLQSEQMQPFGFARCLLLSKYCLLAPHGRMPDIETANVRKI